MNAEENPRYASAIDQAWLEDLANDIGAEELERILILFKENLLEYCEKMRNDIAAQDLIKTKQTAHGIKGLCLQFGATGSMEIARLIEMTVQTADEARVALEKLATEIERVKDFIDSWQGRGGSDARLLAE